MRLVAVALAGLVVSGPAFAQYYGPRPVAPVGPVAEYDVARIVQRMGLDPIGHPVRSGPVYIQRAADYYGRPLRIIVDPWRRQVVSVETGGPARAYDRRYAYGAPYGPRAYPAYGDNLAPPGSVMATPGQPPQAALAPGVQPPAAAAPRPQTRSAAVSPAQTPIPRKRPATAPQEAVGSVEPLARQSTPVPAAPQQDAAPQNTPPAMPPEPAKPAGPTMTPVAPLD